MINIEVLRLEINELLYHVDIFLGENENFKVKEVLKDIVTNYIFVSSSYTNDIAIIHSMLRDLSLVMATDEYTILLKNISTLIRLIKESSY